MDLPIIKQTCLTVAKWGDQCIIFLGIICLQNDILDSVSWVVWQQVLAIYWHAVYQSYYFCHNQFGICIIHSGSKQSLKKYQFIASWSYLGSPYFPPRCSIVFFYLLVICLLLCGLVSQLNNVQSTRPKYFLKRTIVSCSMSYLCCNVRTNLNRGHPSHHYCQSFSLQILLSFWIRSFAMCVFFCHWLTIYWKASTFLLKMNTRCI